MKPPSFVLTGLLLILACCNSLASPANNQNSCAFIVKNKDFRFTFQSSRAAAAVSNLAILKCGSGEVYPDDPLVKKYCDGDSKNTLYVHAGKYGGTCKGLSGPITIYFYNHDKSMCCTSRNDFRSYKTNDKYPNIDIYELSYPQDFDCENNVKKLPTDNKKGALRTHKESAA